jgi:uncharacterized membrane protein
MAEQKTKDATRAARSRGVRRTVSDPVEKGTAAARGASSSVADVAPTETLDDVQDQSQEAVGKTVDQVQGAAGNTLEHVAPESGDQLTVREELASIVRDTTIEVLGPVVRNATKQAARYAVTRGPEIMARRVAPRVRDTVLPAIEEAGGPGALARGAFSSVSDQQAGLLSKVGLGKDRAKSTSLPGTEDWRVPVEESVDVAVPLETAYDQFSQFERFAKFMSQGEKVDERPNERIEWQSNNGAEATGVITFHRLSDRLTRVMVTYDVQPQGVLQKAVSALRMSGRALRTDLLRYKAFVEMTDEDEVAEAGERTDADELEAGRKRPVAGRGSDEDPDGTDDTYDEADDTYDQEEDDLDDEDEETQGDDEEGQGDDEELGPRARTAVRRRAPARPAQKSRQRR